MYSSVVLSILSCSFLR